MEELSIPSVVPVFPLPEVVLFPRAVLPLHVFEPRYRKMMADALAGHRIFATALLKPGFEPQYYTLRAPIHGIVTLGHVIAAEKVAGGEYNALVRGVCRARITEEVPHKPYRLARIELLEPDTPADAEAFDSLRSQLQDTIQTEFVGDRGVQDYWLKLLDTPLGLADVTDLIASALPVTAELQQCLLAEPDPAARATLLREQIRTVAAVTRIRRTQSPEAEWKMN